MLDQYYDYLSQRTIDYFKIYLHPGDRFFAEFDDIIQSDRFFTQIQKYCKVCTFPIDGVINFKCDVIEIEDKRLIIVTSARGITQDFLVTLRNRVSMQEGGWQNTSLLIILHESLDSIKGGSKNLKASGLPLNFESIKATIETTIINSKFSTVDKSILELALGNIASDKFSRVSLEEYSTILSCIHKNEIGKSDLNQFKLFYDSGVSTLENVKAISARLNENNEKYYEIEHCMEYEDRSLLKKIVGDENVDAFVKDKWQDLDFAQIHKWIEITKGSKLKLVPLEFEYLNDDNNAQVEVVKAMSSPLGEQSIFVFGANASGNFRIRFDNTINEDTVSFKSRRDLKHKIDGTTIDFHLVQEDLFYYIDFNDQSYKSSRLKVNLILLPFERAVFNGTLSRMSVDANLKVLNVFGFEDFIVGRMVNDLHEETIIDDDTILNFFVTEDRIKVVPSELLKDLSKFTLNLLINSSFNLKFTFEDVQNDKNHLVSLYELNNEVRQKRSVYSFDKEQESIRSVDDKFTVISSKILKILNYEHDLVTTKCMHINNGMNLPLAVDSELTEKYIDFVSCFEEEKTLPSLTYWNAKTTECAIKYVNHYYSLLGKLQDYKVMETSQRNLSKIGVVIENEIVSFSPFHPLMTAFILHLNKYIDSNHIKLELISKLNPNNLLPYIFLPEKEDDVLESYVDATINNWLFYSAQRKSIAHERESYTSSIVFEKIKQFKQHYDFLFLNEEKAPLIINLINLDHDFDILLGIIRFITKEMETITDFEKVTQVNVSIYKSLDIPSSFELISQISSLDELDKDITVQLAKELKDNIDKADILSTLQKKINFYRYKDEGVYEYSHISFVKLAKEPGFIMNKMSDFENGSQLDGLVSTLFHNSISNDFRVGFGSKFAPRNDLMDLVIKLNEYQYNLNKNGQSAYERDSTITTRISAGQLSKLKSIYNKSNWITFINPEIDLSYLKNSTPELLIIHYSDQLTSFKKYESITVTLKSNQYLHILKEYLSKFKSDFDDEKIRDAISSFNCINGEWLLRTLVNDAKSAQYGREKLSIISAVKYMLSILDTKDILWAPISTEEIVRVAGISKLDTIKSAFSVKHLNESGVLSDDLLFIGLKDTEKKLEVIFYPVEVKIGVNSSSVYKKAVEQVKHMADMIKTHITNNKCFESKYYLNLFIQLALSNINMLNSYNIWSEKQYILTDQIKQKLADGDYEVTVDLENYIGHGAVVSFKKEEKYRSVYMDGKTYVVNLTEDDGYRGIYYKVQEIYREIHNSQTDIDVKNLLTYKISGEMFFDKPVIVDLIDDLEPNTVDNHVEIIETRQTIEIQSEIANNIESEVDNAVSSEISLPDLTENKADETIEEKEEFMELRETDKSIGLDQVSILVGKARGSVREIMWEYGHKQMPNRHLLISGASGQGKTYMIQCMLFELSRKGISSIVFDYTQGFTMEKLEKEFKDECKGKLSQEMVLIKKIPINPFEKQKIAYDDLEFDESPVMVAQRIADIFTHVYDFGDQQYSALYSACRKGLETYSDSMSIDLLEKELEDSEMKEAKTVLSKLKPFFDMSFFRNDLKIDWSEWLYAPGIIKVIQLQGIPKNMQIVLTELILWDIWYFVQKTGNEEKPFVAVMDEAQNLSFKDDAPAAKILTEGRKFGWSAWFATQFLKGQLKPEEISRLQNAAQKMYFLPPDNEISDIANRMSVTSDERKEIENLLRVLDKGRCLFDGNQIVNDKLQRLKPTIVHISPFADRIKKG
jgi:DNA phosphorothioation-dependent restriction protein DptH